MILAIATLVMSASTLDNGHVAVSVDADSGRIGIAWRGGIAIRDAYGEVRVSDREILRTLDLPARTIRVRKVSDALGAGREVEIVSTGPNRPRMIQTLRVLDGRGEVVAQLRVEGLSDRGSNRLTPIVTHRSIDFPSSSPLQSLFVPYDNDNYFRYSSQGWGEGAGNQEGSHEVGALYDDATRQGLIVGSLDHDAWKSGVRFVRDGGFRAVAGVAGKYTHDVASHGLVPGPAVASPRFVLGVYDDWRTGLERYGDLNATVQPPLPWTAPVPFGWNSWSGHKNHLKPADADAALDFVSRDLPWFRSGDTAYINLDSFWDNLAHDQRLDLVRRTHAAGLKAGIYWTPFVNWGEPDWNANDGYKFADLQLRDERGELLPKLDGGWPLDPTHPGTLKRIDSMLRQFVADGYDFIKLDFTTHGALEGRHHDPRIHTGTEAYRVGMQRIVDNLAQAKTGRPIFISLSIAPMFPHGYAHSRRISCDVFSNIGASEYFLNSQNYGWWTAGRLYRFNDPDSACVFRANGEDSTTPAEARTRFTASVIGGGMMFEGDNLTDPDAVARVREVFANRPALGLAGAAPEFRPVQGDTGERAGDLFVHRTAPGEAYIAAFNFSKTDTRKLDIDLERLGLAGRWRARDLWTNADSELNGRLIHAIAPTDCLLLRLTR